MSELFEREEIEQMQNDADKIICFSVRQPWASWIAWRWKPIETRTHDLFKNAAGKRIAIHAAGKIFDEQAFYSAAQFLSEDQRLFASNANYPRGQIICTAFVREHRRLTSADSPLALCECGSDLRFGLVLEDVRSLVRPVPYRGAQGIFQVPRALVIDAL